MTRCCDIDPGQRHLSISLLSDGTKPLLESMLTYHQRYCCIPLYLFPRNKISVINMRSKTFKITTANLRDKWIKILTSWQTFSKLASDCLVGVLPGHGDRILWWFHILMPHTMIILYFRLPYFPVSNNALFSTQYFSNLILNRCSLGTFYQMVQTYWKATDVKWVSVNVNGKFIEIIHWYWYPLLGWLIGWNNVKH